LASHPEVDGALLRASTAKSLNEFGSCFAGQQERVSRAWAFMPTRSGGTFTNAGAGGPAASYWLAFDEAKPINRVRILAKHPAAEVVEAANRCR
jgi:hypothetical protein